MKLMIGIPTLDVVSWQFFLHTSCLVGKVAKKFGTVELCYVNRTAIDRARQITVEDAIRKECDYLLFIDDDTIVPFDAVEKLQKILDEEENRIAATGFCYQRGYKYMPMIYRYEDLVWGKGHSHQLLEPFPNEPFQINAAGMGISLLKVSLLRKIEKEMSPCFGRDGGGTEDFYFFQKADVMKFTSWCDPSVEGTHLGPPQWINSETVKELRERDHKNMFYPKEAGGRACVGTLNIQEEALKDAKS